MLNIVELLTQLVGKVIEHVFNWPFLLFVFLVWLVARFKNQIGSMLDKRGAVPASELSSKIHKEVDPLNKELGLLTTQMTEIQFQLRKIEDPKSTASPANTNDPTKAKLNILESQLQKVEISIGELAGKDEKILRTLNPFQEQLQAVLSNVDSISSKVDSAAPKELMTAMKSDLTKLNDELETMKSQVSDLVSQWTPVVDNIEALRQNLDKMRNDAQKFATHKNIEATSALINNTTAQVNAAKDQINTFGADLAAIKSELQSKLNIDALESLKSDLMGMHNQLQSLKEMVESIQMRLESEPWKESFMNIKAKTDPLVDQIQTISEQVLRLQSDLQNNGSKDVSGIIERDIAPIVQEVNQLKEALKAITERSEMSENPGWMIDVERINQEIHNLRGSVQQLQTTSQTKSKKKK